MSISLKNVSFSFGEKRVLDRFNLTVLSGGRVSLMGPSGCGKSTVLRLIAGLLRPDSGEVSVPPELEELGTAFVFQESRLVSQLSVSENLSLIYETADIPETLAALGLSAESDALPSSLSGGMARRVAIARALISPSPILLLDEPFTGLDDIARTQTAACIHKYSIGRTIVAVTHDEREAELLDATIVRM